MSSSKHRPNPESALDGLLFDGMTIMAGGFGVTGVPERLIDVVAASGVRGLTIISNNCGASGHGLWNLLNNGQIDRLICSFIGDNVLLAEKHLAGAIQVDMTPQGTLAERIRAGGAGIPAFYTRTGVGTLAAEGKAVDCFDGIDYVRERWLRADLSLVKASKGDVEGNLVYTKTARNFNPDMATAGRVTVAEVEQLVPIGALDPDIIHTPGIFVDRIIEGAFYSGAIASRIVRPQQGTAA